MKEIGHEENHAHLNLLQFVQKKAKRGEREFFFFNFVIYVAEVISMIRWFSQIWLHSSRKKIQNPYTYLATYWNLS